ncbi:MAG: GNAT family N-acetyltransferase [Novosphingobium sp.]|uniref:GNAT family N-acetyltransferase n=1 Tax=Novosphingobium sp. TaxID=1874826 RepID=UPI00182585DF|nr:GNAT family N-acetyltransferase [Novosphingobium sp.]
MRSEFETVQFVALGPEIEPLVREASKAGFPFMETLRREWDDGSNRFDQPGEAYFGAWKSGQLVAAGGLNRDPYAQDAAIGRVRHVYVLNTYRRTGVGRLLLQSISDLARQHFTLLRLRTRTEAGAAFYESIGFVRSDEAAATHVLGLQAAA